MIFYMVIWAQLWYNIIVDSIETKGKIKYFVNYLREGWKSSLEKKKMNLFVFQYIKLKLEHI